MYRYIYLYIIIYIYIIARACERMRACTCVRERELCKHVKVSLGDVMLLKPFLEPLDCRVIHRCAV